MEKSNRAKTIKEVLVAAKWMIENIGWCQEDLVIYDRNNNEEAFCATGAISYVNGYGERSIVKDNAIRVLANAIDGYQIHDTTTCLDTIVNFNDWSETTKNKVLSKFDKAIKLSEKI